MIETEDMNLITYSFGHKYILPHATKCFYNAFNFHSKLFDYKPSEKITVLIQDFGDYGNAGATATPRNAITMGLSPFSYAFETSPAGERVYSMMNHELVHIVALDKASKTDRVYKKIFFGKVEPKSDNPISMVYGFLTNPRRYSPRWYHEGIASYLETWMSGGLGLALGSYDEMVFRTKILNNGIIYSAQGLESEGVTEDFQGRSNSYLYGTRFMGYLAFEYGPEKLIQWVSRTDDSRRFFAGQFKNTYGFSINKGWEDWLAFEENWQNMNLELLGQYEITETQPITRDVLGSVSYAYFDKHRTCVYVAINYPGKVPHIASINLKDGSIERLVDVKGAALFYVASLTYDESGDQLFFTTDNDGWRDLNAFDLKTGKVTLLQKDFRTGDLAFNRSDQSLWGIKHLNGYSTIVRIPHSSSEGGGRYSAWEQIHTLSYGEDIFDIDISPDGEQLSAAVTDLLGNQYLLVYDLNHTTRENAVVDTLFNFDVSSPQSFRFTRDGKFLVGTSYYSGVSNIFRAEVETGNIDALTNTNTGLFRPFVLNENELFAFEFVGNGFMPVTVPYAKVESIEAIDYLGNVTVDKHPKLLEWESPLSKVDTIDVDAKTLGEGTYKAGKLMRLNYAYPIVVGYKDNVGLGYAFNISDPLKFKEIDFSLSYTPRDWKNGLISYEGVDTLLDDSELFHFNFSAKAGRFTLKGSFNDANFYDLIGPRQGSRKGINMGLIYNQSLLYDVPKQLQLSVGVSGFYGLDQSPEFQQINTPGFDRNLFFYLNGLLSYSNINSSLGAVDGEKGVRTSLRLSTAFTKGNLFPSLIGNFDYGIQLPGRHNSLWLRTSAGYSYSEDFNPFTRYSFASFGNNYIDYSASRQYRYTFAFPGLEFDAPKVIVSKEFLKVTAEWVLPPIRYRKLGTFNFYANWTQFSFFTSGLMTNDNLTGSNKFANLGLQIDTRMVMFSLLPATLSVGYANAWDLDSRERYGEWMVSLKLLR